MQAYKIALVLAASLGLLLAFVKYLERKSIYFPVREIEFAPAYLNLSFEDVYLDTADGVKIDGWFIPCDNAKYTLFFLHGNGGNISHRLEKIILLHNIGLNIFIIDYRGYGRSSGAPSEAGIYRDAEAGFGYLTQQRKIPADNIIAYGESLGTAAVIDLAAKVKLKGLIIEGGFSSGRDMAGRFFPLIPAFLFFNSFNSLKKIKTVTAAKLFMHSRNDEIVPLGLSQKLFNAALSPKYFTELAGSHNTAFLDAREKYLSAITDFIRQLPP